MNNIITKINNLKEENKKSLGKTISEEMYGLEHSIIVKVELKDDLNYVDEYDEVDENGNLIYAHNKSLKLIDEHYEVTAVKEDNSNDICPHCGKEVHTVHDYRVRYIQDVSQNGKPVFIKYIYKRFFCPSCCKNFVESNADFPRRQKYTKRLHLHIRERLNENVSRMTIAREEHVSPSYVKRILDECPEEHCASIGYVVCMDEFKGNMGKYDKKIKKWKRRKYQTLIMNPETGDLIDILESREFKTLTDYFASIPLEERDKVEYFICDMNPLFINIGNTYFRNAKVVIDRFHYTKAVVGAFESKRQEAQSNMTNKERVKFKYSRFVLLKHNEDLAKMDINVDCYSLDEMLKIAPTLTKPYLLLQSFYEINKSKNKEEARIKLRKFYEEVSEYNDDAFNKAVETLKKHEKGILESFDCKYTNSYAEGTNNLIKVVKRVAFGLKNLERFKKRLRLIIKNYKNIRERHKERLIIRRDIFRIRKEFRKRKAALEVAA